MTICTDPPSYRHLHDVLIRLHHPVADRRRRLQRQLGAGQRGDGVGQVAAASQRPRGLGVGLVAAAKEMKGFTPPTLEASPSPARGKKAN